jgi:hypothetical protein
MELQQTKILWIGIPFGLKITEEKSPALQIVLLCV